MFESELKAKLERIFDFEATFDEPSESNEQERMFIDVSNSNTKVKDGWQTARVTGTVTVYGNNEKLKYGYFNRAIDRAEKADKDSFFFYDLEQNSKQLQNIVQRSFSFVYFFSGQYDPEQGTITSTEISIEVQT